MAAWGVFVCMSVSLMCLQAGPLPVQTGKDEFGTSFRNRELVPDVANCGDSVQSIPTDILCDNYNSMLDKLAANKNVPEIDGNAINAALKAPVDVDSFCSRLQNLSADNKFVKQLEKPVVCGNACIQLTSDGTSVAPLCRLIHFGYMLLNGTANPIILPPGSAQGPPILQIQNDSINESVPSIAIIKPIEGSPVTTIVAEKPTTEIKTTKPPSTALPSKPSTITLSVDPLQTNANSSAGQNATTDNSRNAPDATANKSQVDDKPVEQATINEEKNAMDQESKVSTDKLLVESSAKEIVKNPDAASAAESSSAAVAETEAAAEPATKKVLSSAATAPEPEPEPEPATKTQSESPVLVSRDSLADLPADLPENSSPIPQVISIPDPLQKSPVKDVAVAPPEKSLEVQIIAKTEPPKTISTVTAETVAPKYRIIDNFGEEKQSLDELSNGIKLEDEDRGGSDVFKNEFPKPANSAEYDDIEDIDDAEEEQLHLQQSFENSYKPAKDAKTIEKSNEPIHNFEPNIVKNVYFDDEDSNFFAYFLFVMFVCIILYVGYHNRTKMIALVLEGRRTTTTRAGRRKHTAAYRKLDTQIEEAMSSGATSRAQQIIY